MNIQRRTFLQVLGALGVSVAAPASAVKQLEDFKVVADQCALPVHFTEGGLYTLIAFHRNVVERRSLFPRVPFVDCKRVMDEHGVVDGDLIWAKLPLGEYPPRKELTPARDNYFVPGGLLVTYSAETVLYAHDGRAFQVRKNRGYLSMDPTTIRVPQKMHTTEVPILHPLNNVFSGKSGDVGEILIL